MPLFTKGRFEAHIEDGRVLLTDDHGNGFPFPIEELPKLQWVIDQLRAGTVQPQEHAKATSVGAASQIDLSTTEAAAFKAGWQPIESNLKDGQPFVGGQYHRVYGWLWGRVRWYEDKHSEGGGYFAGDVQPTHWMPLPDPPVRSSQAGSVNK